MWGSRASTHASASTSGSGFAQLAAPQLVQTRRVTVCVRVAALPDAPELVGGSSASDASTQQTGPQGIAAFPYQRVPCSSPCAPGDVRCQQLEAVFQHVLNYPRIPTRVCQWLPTIKADMAVITRTVEGLARKYGQELTLVFLRRAPHLLHHDLDTLTSRAEHLRSMLDLRPAESLGVLRKNPNVFCLEPTIVRNRFNALHKVLPLSHDGVRSLVRKYPLVLNYQTSSLEEIMEGLRQVCYSRVQWQQDYENLSPGLTAFFFRDSADIMDRLEFLAVTGATPFASLRDVMKMTNNTFARKHRTFRAWLDQRAALVRRREQLLMQREAQMQAQQAVMAKLQEKRSAGQLDGPTGRGRGR